MPRAHLYRTITDNAGNLRPGGVVRVLYPRTTDEITEALYPNDFDTVPLPNPFTSTDGVIDFYMEQPFRVRIGVKFPNESERFFNDVDVMLPFDEGAPVHGHPYALINHTHEGDFSLVGHRHPANGIDLVPTGTVAATNLQDAVLELNQDQRAHEAAADPHPQYLTVAEGDTLFVTHIEGDARYSLLTHVHQASEIPFAPFATITATTVQAAIEEVVSESSAFGAAQPTVTSVVLSADAATHWKVISDTTGILVTRAAPVTSPSVFWLTSPDGAYWRLGVTAAGAVTTTAGTPARGDAVFSTKNPLLLPTNDPTYVFALTVTNSGGLVTTEA